MESDTQDQLHIILRKKCSVGEYDPKTGMTYVTRKRGRLLFQMGTSRGGMIKHKKLNLKTGSFSGLILFPEEVYYLLLRDGLEVYLYEDISCTAIKIENMSINFFLSYLLRSQMRIECLHAYNFLKMNKLHPRRHIHDEKCGQQGTSASSLHDDQKCSIVYEVCGERQAEIKHKESDGEKSNVKIACKIIVCRFEAKINILSFKRHLNIPTKIVVCDCEGSILVFEIGKNK